MSKRFILLFSSITLILSAISFVQAQIITEQPQTQGVIEGDTASFSVHTSGGTSFQWYRNDTLIVGATDSVYNTPPTTLALNEANYKVVVSDGVNPNDTSDVAILYVTASGSRVTGGEVVLYKFNEGGGTTIHDSSGFGSPLDLTINSPSNVSWSPVGLLVKDTALINSSTATKIIDASTTSNEYTVELWVRPLTTNSSKIFNLTFFSSEVDFGVESLSNGYNFVTRTTATNNQGIPGILESTGLGTDTVHIVFTFRDGMGKIYKNGIEVGSDSIGGDFSTWNNQARLSLASSLSGAYPFNGIFYLAAVYNRALDSIEVSHNFSIGTAVEEAPFIIKEPQNKKVSEGTTTTFKVSAIGNTPLSYQWQKNGTNIAGATDTFYTTPVLTLADSGNVYSVIVTNSSGSDTSQATLEVVAGGLVGSPAGMTHYYKLEESAPPYIDSFGFTDATSSNPPSQVTGIVGNAQNFSGLNKIDIPDDNISDWDPNGSFSLEFWMKTTATPSDVNVAIGRDDASSDLHWWVGFNPDGKVTFQLRDINNEGIAIGDKDPVVNDGNWHLITAIRDGDLGRNYLYIDGSKVDSADQTYNASFEGSVVVNIGYLNLAPYYYFNGDLDEVAMYNVALSQSEIQEHYNNGQVGHGYNKFVATPSNLVAIKNVTDTTNVDLSWNDNSSNELGFIIQRAMGDTATATGFTNIDTVNADVTTYTDTTTSDTTTYTYRVYGYNSELVSGFSNKAQITTAVPVELTSFTANVSEGKVILNWQTATEINNSGFSIQRSNDNRSFKEIAFVRGHGTTTDKSVYSYTDNSVLAGKHYYRLKQVDFNGSFSYTSSVEVNIGIPKNFSLDQNYPNPFNPSTTIRFALPTSAKVSIKLYNTLGQEVVNILNNEQLNAGVHETIFNASNFPSGVYFYRLEAKGDDGSSFAQTKRMVLIK